MTVRPAWHGTIAGVVLILVWSAARSASAQDPQYLALLDAYAGGNIQVSVAVLAVWPEPRVRAAVGALGPHPGLDRARAAAMLHTEAAFAVNPDRRFSIHLEAARTFVRGMSGDDRARLFVPRWHALAVALHIMRNDLFRARQELNRGLAEDANSKDLELAAGVIGERVFQNAEHNPRGRWNTAERDRLERQLKAVLAAYERALARDPGFLEARLRLGWALLLNHSSQRARDQLEQVAARAARADVRYLAHLFLAAVDEREQRLDEAAREYEAAHAAAPHQTSFVALIRIERARGHDDRAQRLAAEFAALSARSDEDPWWYYNSGITSGELLEWLRAEARAR